jgi:C1A family cysteine protease
MTVVDSSSTQHAVRHLSSRSVRRFGWIPDLPDQRDFIYAAPPPILANLPSSMDLRPACPPVYDQGALGSCTANAIAAALEFDQAKQGAADVFVPSRLFIYYNERAIEGSVGEDAGAMLRDGIKSVAQVGAPHESVWPYIVAKFRTKPPAKAFTDAAAHQALLYQRLRLRADQLRGCLASGFPFVFGFTVYESFDSPTVAKTGRVPLPTPFESPIGGHAVLAVGYDDARAWFIVRNSWGPAWGMRGYFTMPYDYVLDPNLCDDFWTIRRVEG